MILQTVIVKANRLVMTVAVATEVAVALMPKAVKNQKMILEKFYFSTAMSWRIETVLLAVELCLHF